MHCDFRQRDPPVPLRRRRAVGPALGTRRTCFSLVAWIVGSYVLRWVLTVTSDDSASIYGPLAAPIAVLLWLYVVAIAVLIGAAVNAAFDEVFPQQSTVRARSALSARWRDRVGGGAGRDVG